MPITVILIVLFIYLKFELFFFGINEYTTMSSTPRPDSEILLGEDAWQPVYQASWF